MKLRGRRQSRNVEDRSRDTSVSAPHRNPQSVRAIVESRSAEMKSYEDRNRKTLGEAKRRKNSISPMLKGIGKRLKSDPGAKIPIPTPRPTPDKNYKHPKLWRY